MAVKLTAPQQAVVDHMKADGGRMVRVNGGFWTTPSIADGFQAKLRGSEPPWYVGVQTLRALVKKGVLQPDPQWNGLKVDEYRRPYTLVGEEYA